MCLARYSLCTYTDIQAVDTPVSEKKRSMNHTAVLLSWRASALNGTLQPLSRSRAWIVALTTRDYMQVLYISHTLWGPFIIRLEKKKVCLQVNKSTWVYKSLLGKKKNTHSIQKHTCLTRFFFVCLNDVQCPLPSLWMGNLSYVKSYLTFTLIKNVCWGQYQKTKRPFSMWHQFQHSVGIKSWYWWLAGVFQSVISGLAPRHRTTGRVVDPGVEPHEWQTATMTGT